MAKYEENGYCPHQDVASAVNRKDADRRLLGLWFIIGPSMVCIDGPNNMNVDRKAVVDMLSNDPIAFELMKQIIQYNANAEKIAIKQIFNGACNTQSAEDIQKILLNDKDARVVVCNGSHYIVIITEADYGIDLHFWDLRRCM